MPLARVADDRTAPESADAWEADALLAALCLLATARDLQTVMAIVRCAARKLTRADGVTFVLREGPMVHYAPGTGATFTLRVPKRPVV